MFNQRPPESSVEAIALCKKPVAKGHSPSTLAIWAVKCSASAQHSAHSRWEPVKSQAVFKHKCRHRTCCQSHFSLSHLCIAKWSTRQIYYSQVEPLLPIGGQPTSLTFSCMQFILSPKSVNWTGFSVISPETQWLLWDHQVWSLWYKYAHHMTSAGRHNSGSWCWTCAREWFTVLYQGTQERESIDDSN